MKPLKQRLEKLRKQSPHLVHEKCRLLRDDDVFRELQKEIDWIDEEIKWCKDNQPANNYLINQIEVLKQVRARLG